MFHVFWGAMLAACMWPTCACNPLKVLTFEDRGKDRGAQVQGSLLPASSKITLTGCATSFVHKSSRRMSIAM